MRPPPRRCRPGNWRPNVPDVQDSDGPADLQFLQVAKLRFPVHDRHDGPPLPWIAMLHFFDRFLRRWIDRLLFFEEDFGMCRSPGNRVFQAIDRRREAENLQQAEPGRFLYFMHRIPRGGRDAFS